MISKRYSCDGGSLAVGTSSARYNIINNYGDGCHDVVIAERNENFGKDEWYEFRGAIEGTDIKVFRYDCLSNEECEDEKNVLFNLSGRFGVFAEKGSGTIVLQRWE